MRVKHLCTFYVTKNVMKLFGIKIKELREEKGLLQKDIAQFLNTSRQNISRWEIGIIEPDLETVVKLSRFFDVSADYLLGLED